MSGDQEQVADVVIVGGGAAGFFAAIHCAEAAPALRVVILEQGPKVLTKVLVSGGGRCNVTHACFDPAELVKRYPRGERELRGPFHGWQPGDTVDWFKARGVELKTEVDGRMFPTTDRSDTIADCLTRAARDAGAEVRTRCGVTSISSDDHGFALICTDGTRWLARRLMLATGGLKKGAVMRALEQFVHHVETPVPSLFTFHVEDPRLTGLQGLSVERVCVSVPGTGLQENGPMLVTHWGLSGPAVLKLSAWGARELRQRDYRFTCRVNWVPAIGDVSPVLRAMKQSDGRRRVAAMSLFELPRRLWERLVAAADVPESQTWSQVSGRQLDALVAELTAGDFTVTGKSMNKEEFVTCGGVSLKEVSFKTMESRKVSGLYFGGELLDIDAITGGFNFQAAWTTGRTAGLAMADAGRGGQSLRWNAPS